MASLRRTLYLGAALTALFGLALAIAPHFWLVTVANQRAYPDYAGARLLGVGAFSHAMLMTMVANHLEDTWWWSWAFVVSSGGLALVALAKGSSDPSGPGAVAWWGLCGVSALLAASLLRGLAKTGTERPPV